MNDHVRKQIAHCEEHPVRSRGHQWVPGEKAQYDSLHHRGRSLYDNLRTQFDWEHLPAFEAALDAHGHSKAWEMGFKVS